MGIVFILYLALVSDSQLLHPKALLVQKKKSSILRLYFQSISPPTCELVGRSPAGPTGMWEALLVQYNISLKNRDGSEGRSSARTHTQSIVVGSIVCM
jgi:hypothetical protein